MSMSASTTATSTLRQVLITPKYCTVLYNQPSPSVSHEKWQHQVFCFRTYITLFMVLRIYICTVKDVFIMTGVHRTFPQPLYCSIKASLSHCSLAQNLRIPNATDLLLCGMIITCRLGEEFMKNLKATSSYWQFIEFVKLVIV